MRGVAVVEVVALFQSLMSSLIGWTCASQVESSSSLTRPAFGTSGKRSR